MSERLLPRPVVLRSRRDPSRPVTDLERLCRVVLDGHVRSSVSRGKRMQAADYEEALAFLLGESWLLVSRYDPRRGGVPFPAWLQGQLAYRLVDHLRAPYGTRREPRFGTERLAELDRRTPDDERDPLDALVAGGEGDPPDGKMLSDGWTQAEIANSLGRSSGWVSERVVELRRELEAKVG